MKDLQIKISYIDYLIAQLQVYDVHVNCNNHNLCDIHNITVHKVLYKKIFDLFGIKLYIKHIEFRNYHTIQLPTEWEKYCNILIAKLLAYTDDFYPFEIFAERFIDNITEKGCD